MSAAAVKYNLVIEPSHRVVAVPHGIELHHLSPTIGTEVHGIDLREPLSAEHGAFLDQLFLQRQVLFFRDQDITTEQHMTLCRRWGELEEIPFLKQHADHKEVLVIERDAKNRSYENVWHSDVTWREKPSLGSMLRCHVAPEIGGDTMWADMALAYDNLPAWMKRAVDGLQAVHSVTVSLGVFMSREQMGDMEKLYPPAVHPVIRTHPVTGRKLIYVNRAHTSHIKGISREDSRYLLEYLYAQATVPEYQCRFHWRRNSIAFWDNRATQHYAVVDYHPAPRKMERVTVMGDKPF